MPELAERAPSLIGLGARLNRDWIARWVHDPAALRADTAMPRVLTNEQEARDVAAFLASLGAPAKRDAPGLADPAAGGALFATLGCIACHPAPGRAPEDESDRRVSLRHLAAKWRRTALERYLARPHEHDPWTRMPDFRLDGIEARALAAFLVQSADEPMPPIEGPAEAQRGRTLIRERGCLNCHDVHPRAGRESDLRIAPAIQAAAAGGCLADEPGSAPRYGLEPSDRAAIAELLAAAPDALFRRHPGEYAHRQIENLRCAACHRMDGRPDAWSHHEAEVGHLIPYVQQPADEDDGDPELAQTRPSLDHAGEMFRSQWLERRLAGTLATKPRPWLEARMPGFASRARLLAVGMTGYASVDRPRDDPEPDPDQVAIGRKLVGADGFGCVQCHATDRSEPVAVFEARGIDFPLAFGRLRKPYFLRWLRDPARIDPDTKMPRFLNESGASTLPGFCDGDADRQFEAIWQYLRSIRGRDP